MSPENIQSNYQQIAVNVLYAAQETTGDLRGTALERQAKMRERAL